MKTKTKITLLSGLVALVGAIQPVTAATDKSHMETTGRTSQPIGHYEYCRKYRADCNIRTKNSQAPKLTRARWKDLVDVNLHSNTVVRPVTDMEFYRVEELWAYPKEYGDCEDYVLMKRHMLMKRGWPASSLLVTVVRQANGDGHAVLTVRTDRADYILDNLDNKIKPWNETGYRYLKRQSVNNSGHWAKIADQRRI